MPKRSGSVHQLSQGGLPELRSRLFFVLLGVVVFRVGAHIPVPGLNLDRLADLFSGHQNSLLGLFNMFSGGALSRLTVFALGVMPYISASIIMQLFTAVIPKLDQLKKESDQGRKRINQYTRNATLCLATFQAIGIAKWLTTQGIVLVPGWYFYFIAVITLATGTMILIWLGEQMTQRGIGNGISLIIFSGIVSHFPEAISQLLNQVRQGQMPLLVLLLFAVVVLLVTAFVVFVERGQRRIAVHYAKRQHGAHMTMAHNSHLPLKINMSGVIPPIFASSIILFPATLAQLFGQVHGLHWLNDVSFALSPGQPLYMMVFGLAILGFCYFYTALAFNPKETAENLKKSGGFIPGIRPGQKTADYIDQVMSRLTLSGAGYLIVVSLLPQVLILAWHVPFYFGGTSLLIVVVVVMDFISQVQTHLIAHKYDAMMKKQVPVGNFNKKR